MKSAGSKQLIRVFGVANHEPSAVVRALVKARRAALPDVGIVPVSFALPAKPSHSFLLFLTVRDFFHNLDTLKSPKYAGVSALVFSNPLKLNEIKSIVPLDYEPNPNYPGFGFTLGTLNLCKMKNFKGVSVESVGRIRHNYLSRLVRHVQQGSLLNPFMTFIYSLPSTSQNVVKTAALLWLYHGKSPSYLNTVLDNLPVTITSRAKQKIKDIILTEVGSAFQQAFAEYRRKLKQERKEFDVAEIAKTFFVSDYEMRYILSVVESSQQQSKYNDSFDKAKNRKR